ncbi:MAG: histidine kinase [Ginsengibacter sp.]
MKWKYIPYLFIFFFSIIVGTIRFFVISQWPWTTHVLVFFIQIAFLSVTWLLVLSINTYLDHKIPFEKNITNRIVLQVVISILFDAPFYILLMMNSDKLHLPFITSQFLAILSILFFVFILFLNLGYNAYYFFRQWQKSIEEKAQLLVQAAELKMDKSMMQYHHLKNQVNPHFLFNSLSSLDGLIHSNPDLASKFIWHLSKVYRYVLEHKENEIVSLQTELDFIQHYISLLTLRYKNVLAVNLEVSDAAMDKGIVMVTLQMLIDNAIKHNSLEAASPLLIRVWDEKGFLHIHNNKQLRKQIELSTRQGLQKLRELYSYLSPLPVDIADGPESFEIIVPLL